MKLRIELSCVESDLYAALIEAKKVMKALDGSSAQVKVFHTDRSTPESQDSLINGIPDLFFSRGAEGSMVINPHFVLVNTVAYTLSTWVPSVTDCIAHDWEIVPFNKYG